MDGCFRNLIAGASGFCLVRDRLPFPNRIAVVAMEPRLGSKFTKRHCNVKG
jgi:hypothetical protein